MRLVGVAEVCELLNVQRQTLKRLRAKGFPEPVEELRAGPVWRLAEVEAWRDHRTAIERERVSIAADVRAMMRGR